MAVRGRTESVLPEVNLGKTLEIHLTGKITKKRQNFDSSTPHAHT
jgi:hypothetical protein